jgi:hypothetical protein
MKRVKNIIPFVLDDYRWNLEDRTFGVVGPITTQLL